MAVSIILLMAIHCSKNSLKKHSTLIWMKAAQKHMLLNIGSLQKPSFKAGTPVHEILCKQYQLATRDHLWLKPD